MNILDGLDFGDIVFDFPGACIRWVIGNCFGKDKAVIEYLKEDTMANRFLGVFLWMVGLILYNVLKTR